MALQLIACGFPVMIIFLCEGCHSQPPACGVAVSNSRIVGGQDVTLGSWPWFAGLYIRGGYLCGGSLITNQWVLTAAHCITIDYLRDSTVRLGLHNRTGVNPNEVSRTLKDIVRHPAYSNLTKENDICLLKLSTPVTFTDYIQPICLASAGSTFHSGISSWVIGFGKTGSGSLPSVLHEVDVPIVGNNECSCNYFGVKKITDKMICAGHREGGKDACQGDSGGPLMTKNDNLWIQSGIVSSGVGCALPNTPGVYTRISKYQEWIANKIDGMAPGFVTFTSPGNDSDLDFFCPTSAPTTVPAITTTTVPAATKDKSLFSRGKNLIHFTYFVSLCVLAVSSHVLV